MAKSKPGAVKFQGKRPKTARRPSAGKKSGGGKGGSNKWRAYVGTDNSPIPY